MSDQNRAERLIETLEGWREIASLDDVRHLIVAALKLAEAVNTY